VIGDTVYAVGGDVNQGAGSLSAEAIVESWTPPADGWDDAAVADLPQACGESQAFGIEGATPEVILAGCGSWPGATRATYVYDVTSNAWSLSGGLKEVRRNHAGALITTGGETIMYLVGGYGGPDFVNPIRSSEVSPLPTPAAGAASVTSWTTLHSRSVSSVS
jgi:hypothetical protein